MDASGNWILTHDEQVDDGGTEGGYQYSDSYSGPDGESGLGTQSEQFHLVFSNNLILDRDDETGAMDPSGQGQMRGHGEGRSAFTHTNPDGSSEQGMDNYTIDAGWTIDFAVGNLAWTIDGHWQDARQPGDSYNGPSSSWSFGWTPVITSDMNMLPTTHDPEWTTAFLSYGQIHPEQVTGTTVTVTSTRTPTKPYDPGPVTNPPWVEKTARAAGVVSTVCFTLAGGIGVVTAVRGLAAEGLAEVGGVAVEELAAEGETSGTVLARQLGQEGEAAANIVKNTEQIPSATGTANYRIPDILDHAEQVIGDVKNVARQGFTRQIQDSLYYALQNDYDFVLIVRQSTTFTPPLQALIDNGFVNILRLLP